MQKSIHSADYQHFLTELRTAREEAGVTQEQLASILGEHQAFVSKVERGVRRMDVIELFHWLKALGIPLAGFAESLDDRLARHRSPKTTRRSP